MRTETLLRLLGIDLVSAHERMPTGYCPARNFGLGIGKVQWGSVQVDEFEGNVIIPFHAAASSSVEFVHAEAEDGSALDVWTSQQELTQFMVMKSKSRTVIHWAALTI